MASVEYESEYRELYQNCPLKNIIIFRSGPMPESYIKGMDFDDNARALFEYALSINLQKEYELVWLVKNPEEWEDKFSCYNNIFFFSYEDAESEDKVRRDKYFRALCLAKYIFMTDTYGFAMRSRADQTRIMLWHGCGFKARLGNCSCADKYEYMTVTGDEYARIYAEAFGLRSEQMLVTGYPKVDYIFHPLSGWQKILNIPKASKYIFWLPTFRNTDTEGLERHNHTKPKGETGLPLVNSLQELRKIDEILSAAGTILLIKLHPFQNRSMVNNLTGFLNIYLLEHDVLLEHGIHINHLLGYADALISDYSSVAVDYLVLDRPIGFTLDDMDTYGKERGFFWEDVRKWLPGEEIYNFQDFISFIRDVMANKNLGYEKRKSISEQMQKYRDDQNSLRVLNVLGICQPL